MGILHKVVVGVLMVILVDLLPMFWIADGLSIQWNSGKYSTFTKEKFGVDKLQRAFTKLC